MDANWLVLVFLYVYYVKYLIHSLGTVTGHGYVGFHCILLYWFLSYLRIIRHNCVTVVYCHGVSVNLKELSLQ